MVRETRHLWVGNLPDNIREDKIREHFKRYGRVQNVKLLGRMENASNGASGTATTGVCATVAFMDIKSASKAHNVEHVLDERTLTTEYYEPTAIPSAAGAPSAGSSPAGSGYSGSSSSVNSAPAPVTASRYHLSGEESAGNACAMAASAAAPAAWRGTNDSATDYCRRGNTPASYTRYRRNNSNAPYATQPSNIERTTHPRWYASGERAGAGGGSGTGCTTGGGSTPSTPEGVVDTRRRHSGSGSSRSDSSSPEPSDTSRASTPAAPPPLLHHANHRTPPSHPHQWASTLNGRPLAICVRNLPARSTDSSLKDGLYHEYKKHGKVVWVKVVGQSAERYAVVRFKKPSDVDKALEVSQDKLFFGCKISVAPHQNCDEDCESAKPYETDIDEYHPKATRTLFIGNLEKDVTQQQLREKFKHFGRIIEIDIKKGSGGGAGYAFCQYASISSVVEAIRAMDGEYVGGSRVKLGFGKPVATTCVWVDGLTEHTEKQVLGAVSRCGAATSVCVDRAAGAALVHFEQAAAAGAAVRELRRVAAQASAAEPAHPRLCVDYASRECQEAFYEQLEKHGGTSSLTGTERLPTDSRYVPGSRHDQLRYDGSGSRSRAPSFGRGTSRTRYSAQEHYDPVDYAADRRYRVYDELGSSPQTDEAAYEDRLQSVVVSPHRGHRHRRDSSPEERKHSKERHRSLGVASRRSRSGSRGERHAPRRRHRRRRDGSGSRAGTPLRDEPDAPPSEPRRPPRDRPPLPMSLPLPKFAVQLLRAAPPVPRQPPPPAPAPDSPPRPPSVSSSSGGSAPHSPSLEERIRSLDEKYEKWSGSARALSDAPDRARLRHRLLEVDINEVKPSEVVRSLLAKRSVFDEDSERLEGSVRAPSPTGSPRSRGAGPLPRSLRYPFPTHAPPEPDSESDRSDRPVDPRLARADRPDRPPQPDRLLKVNEADYKIEPRTRPRTPSTDKLQVDICESKTNQPLDKDRSDSDRESTKNDKHRRDSCLGKDEERNFNCVDPEDILEALRDDQDIDTVTHRSSGDRCQEKDGSSVVDNLRSSEELNKTGNNIFSGRVSTESGDLSKPDLENNSENKTRTTWIPSNKQDRIFQPEKSIREVSDNNFLMCEYSSRLEMHHKDGLRIKNLSETKPDDSNSQTKNEIERLKDNAIPNHIDKEILSFHINIPNHLNVLNSIESTSKPLEPSHEVSNDRNEKQMHNHVNVESFQKDKFEKENIEHDKSHDILKHVNNVYPHMDKKSNEDEKKIDEDILNERDKVKQNKDRIDKDKYDNEKERNKISKINKAEKNEKEKKSKDEMNFHKSHTDKANKKVEKDLDKCDEKHRDSEKVKHVDDKPLRHENHRKDRHEKDKSKHSGDSETINKNKKEEKHKYERPKKDSDVKRDSKKDTDSTKSRKSSKDESSRDLCRKDSTDSSASRTSHDSSKLRDSDSNDIKDESRSKFKGCNESFNKNDHDNDSGTKIVDSTKSESKSKTKVDNTEEKDSDQLFKPKIDHNHESGLTQQKHKVENIEKQRHYSLDSSGPDSKRKERLNSCSSLPSNIGHKRRISSQDSLDCLNDDSKKCKNEVKCPERRDSKDSRSTERHKSTKFNKGHFAKIIESKTKDDKKNQVKPPDDTFLQLKEMDGKETVVPDKTKNSKKSSKEDNIDNVQTKSSTQSGVLQNDLDFLATLELRSSEEDERQKALRKEMKEKKRIQQLQQIQELQMQQDALQQAEILNKIKEDKKHKTDERKKELAREKRMSTDRKSKDEKIEHKRKNRKQVQSSDTSDSDEPKKHSIFDIVDDGPTYISMYDKVKARSCKNMQKQEEEKRQEKIKAKFSQLKQSRAKREEKKRSSWDEDSDSDHERRKTLKTSVDSSSEEDHFAGNNKKHERSHIDYDRHKCSDYFNTPSNEEETRNKLSRKNSRSRIMSDTSEDDVSKRNSSKSPVFVTKIKKEIFSDSESNVSKSKDCESLPKELSDDKIKRTSLLNLFGKSDSDDCKVKSNIENDNDYKVSFPKVMSNEISSETESIPSNRNINEQRKKHKKKQKKHKFSFSDEEYKIENSNDGVEGDIKHKYSEKNRRHSNKKERRKDKIRESVEVEELREEKNKLKKEKKSPGHCFDLGSDISSNNTKKDGKMEDIFGPLSDDSDKESSSIPNSKLQFVSHNYEPILGTSNEKSKSSTEDLKHKEDFKRRKERKRKEKRSFIREDDNSLDVDAVSKAIEARLFADSTLMDETRIRVETIIDNLSKNNHCEDRYVNNIKSDVSKMLNKHTESLKKENRDRERKKKKKRNKEDRQSRKEHHHFYHNDKDSILDKFDAYDCGGGLEIVTNSMLLDIPLPNDEQIKDTTKTNDSLLQSPSLPRLTESPSRSQSNANNDNMGQHNSDIMIIDKISSAYEETKCIEVHDIPMPPPFENIVQNICDVPLPKDPRPIIELESTNTESIPIPSIEIDVSSEDSNENAVRSISNLDEDSEKHSEKIDTPTCKIDKKLEEKPRAIISQEETEDAVAALLGESFGGKVDTFSNCYEEVENNPSLQIEIENTAIESENIPEEDAEEMRQAVQNLNASEMEMKPDTPVSDSDLLLIDTDTEEPEETPQDAIERLPINIIATNQALNNNSKTNTPKTSEVSSIIISKPKSTLVHSLNPENETNIKLNEKEIKIPLIKRDSIHHITAITTTSGTPVITTWTLSNSKLVEPQVLNLPSNSIPNRDSNENKPKHITANIVQIKNPQNQNVQINSPLRPILNTNRVTAPYQVINQIIRPPVSIMQPPTIKIPEPHMIYQKPQGIVISPRMTNESKLQSPKSSPQGEARTSPRLSNMTVLNTTSQNLNHIGITSPTTIQQRSPGQVTVVRMQQPPLSPLQGVAVPHTVRAMVSPNRPNSVLVQTSMSSPINFNRLPVTPVLAPISKQMSTNNLIQQNKSVVPTTTLIQQQKLPSKTGEPRKNEQKVIAENVNDTSKIILSPTRLQSNTNATVLAQNRLISMQNAAHAEKINSNLHLANKVLINSKSPISDKRDSQVQKSEDLIPFGSPPIIHVAGVNHSVAPIIQNYTKPIVCNLHQPNTTNRGQNTNVIHALNQQRLLTTAPITSVIQLDASKVSSSVLSMATIRHPSMLTKSESTHCTSMTTSSIPKVVMTPVLLKTSSKPNLPGTIQINTKMDLEHEENIASISSNHILCKEEKVSEQTSENLDKHQEVIKSSKTPEHIAKCETDFEELLKDNTNEIKTINSPEKKLEVNIGKPVPVLSQHNEIRISLEERNKDDCNKGIEKINQESSLDDVKNEDTATEITVKLDIEEKKENSSEEITPKEGDSASLLEKCNIPSENLPMDSSKLVHNELDTLPVLRKLNNEHSNDIFDSLSLTLEKNDRDDKNLDENDFWTAKDVNIDSVIKKVDSLCNESSDLNVEKEVVISNDTDESNLLEPVIQNVSFDEPELNKNIPQPEPAVESNILIESPIEKNIVIRGRGGRGFRGRKSDKVHDRVQTRQISKPARGTGISKRGRGRAKVDKKIKSLVTSNVNNIPGDVYDFHEDSGDESASNKPESRPRLILTIKSPLSGQSNATPTSTLSITQKEITKHFEKPSKDDKIEVFASPTTNTRKSRRLQEKDVHRSNVDDGLEDVIKGSPVQPRINKDPNKKRTTRQANAKIVTEKNQGLDTRKSPRGVKRTRDRSLSDASIDSNEESSRRDDVVKDAKVSKLGIPTVEPAVSSPSVFGTTIATQIQAPVPAPVHTSITPLVPPSISAPVSVAASIPAPVSVPQTSSTPIMKPPKKMISEISAKLAGAFEAAIAVPTVPAIPAASMTLQERTAPPPERTLPEAERSVVQPPKVADPVLIMSGAAGNVPGTMVAVGATEATDARGQSPALPHRPPSTHRPADRATPILVRGGDGDIGAGVAGVAGMAGAVGGVRGYRGAYAGPASLPRGAHLPQHPQHPQHPQLSPHTQHSPHSLAKQVPVIGPHHQLNSASRVTITSVPAVSPQGQMSLSAELDRSPPPAHQQTSPITSGERGMYPHFSHQHYQMYQQHFRATQDQCRTSSSPYPRSLEAEGSEAPTPPLELRRPAGARVPRPAHSPAQPAPAHPAHPAPAHPASAPPVAPAAPPPSDRLIMYAVGCGRSPPPTYGAYRPPSSLPPPAAQGPPHASQVPREADSLQMLLRRYPVMWQGLLALKNDSAAVQMHFVGGNPGVAADALSRHSDGTAASLLRIAQRMRLEQAQLDQVHRKMKMDIEHCMLLALPCGRDHMDVLQQSTNLSSGFITYLQRKQAAGIVNVAPTPGHQQSMYTVHIFPSCDFANENLTRIAPDLMHRVTNIAHLLIVIATATA